MKVIYDKENQKVPVKTWSENPEEGAIKQALDAANHPNVFHHVSLMPDTHQGYGVPIGAVVPLKDAISPNMVGVDIGCGMCACNTGIRHEDISKDDILGIMAYARQNIPVGKAHRTTPALQDHGIVQGNYNLLMAKMKDHFGHEDNYAQYLPNFEPMKIMEQIGTLGTNNHFWEIQVDPEGNIWIMIHSGSRNIGYQVAEFYHKEALRFNEAYNSELPHKDLAFIPTANEELFDRYWRAMNFCLDFAYQNRLTMMQFGLYHLGVLSERRDHIINIHHNYASLENHYGTNVYVHRKGATLARNNTIGIIPGSFKSASYIVRGKGDNNSFTSCSHGAGRVMGRRQAQDSISDEDFQQQLSSVTSFGVSKDEAPSAYKDIDIVMREQQDLVEVTTELKSLMVLKGNDDKNK